MRCRGGSQKLNPSLASSRTSRIDSFRRGQFLWVGALRPAHSIERLHVHLRWNPSVRRSVFPILANTRQDAEDLYGYVRLLGQHAKRILLLHIQGLDLSFDSLSTDGSVKHAMSMATLSITAL